MTEKAGRSHARCSVSPDGPGATNLKRQLTRLPRGWRPVNSASRRASAPARFFAEDEYRKVIDATGLKRPVDPQELGMWLNRAALVHQTNAKRRFPIRRIEDATARVHELADELSTLLEKPLPWGLILPDDSDGSGGEESEMQHGVFFAVHLGNMLDRALELTEHAIAKTIPARRAEIDAGPSDMADRLLIGRDLPLIYGMFFGQARKGEGKGKGKGDSEPARVRFIQAACRFYAIPPPGAAGIKQKRHRYLVMKKAGADAPYAAMRMQRAAKS